MNHFQFRIRYILMLFCLSAITFTTISCEDESEDIPPVEKPTEPSEPEVPEEPKAPDAIVEQGETSTQTTESSVEKSQKITVTTTDDDGNEVKSEYLVETKNNWIFVDETVIADGTTYTIEDCSR